jgi:hypothetical protein
MACIPIGCISMIFAMAVLQGPPARARKDVAVEQAKRLIHLVSR